MGTLEIVQTLIAALQANDLELAASKMSESFRLQGLGPRELKKRELLAVQSELHAGMSDFSYNLAELREEAGRVKGSVAIAGTQTGELNLPLFGLARLPATGLSISLPEVAVLFQTEGEQVSLMQIEELPGGGMAGLIQQLGTVLPAETFLEDIKQVEG